MKKLRRQAIQSHKPWLKSTGPRSWLGKIIARQNATKHGLYSRWMSAEERKAFATFAQSVRDDSAKPAMDFGELSSSLSLRAEGSRTASPVVDAD